MYFVYPQIKFFVFPRLVYISLQNYLTFRLDGLKELQSSDTSTKHSAIAKTQEPADCY